MSDPWQPPSHAFWNDEFPAHTAGRTAPHLFKSMIPPTIASPRDALAGFEAIRRAHTAGAEAAKARIYVGEDRRDDLLPEAMKAPGWEGDGNFPRWMQNLVGAERFSLVINNMETVSPTLAAGLGTFLDSLAHGWGVPLGGAEQVAFIGNYSGTAFGVHEGFEDAFLIHLGPGTKHFYTWHAEEYEKLTGGKEPHYGDYAWLLEHGQHFVLEPGDALFLPRRVFHVGTQEQFSISVALPLYTYPDAGILRESVLPELFASLLTSSDPDDELNAPSPMTPLASAAATIPERLAGRARATLATATERVEDAVAQHADRRWATVLSNGGWEVPESDFARAEAAAAFDAQQVMPGTSVSLIPPYKVKVAGERVFLRGFQTNVAAAVLSSDTIAALNDGRAVTLPDDEEVLLAVQALGATGGLHIADHPTATEDTPS